jgi:hypothetical protein
MKLLFLKQQSDESGNRSERRYFCKKRSTDEKKR